MRLSSPKAPAVAVFAIQAPSLELGAEAFRCKRCGEAGGIKSTQCSLLTGQQKLGTARKLSRSVTAWDRSMQQSPARSRLVAQILGRAENVVGFIRRGESEAWTEIHLAGGSGRPDVVILRKMKIADKVRADGTEYQGVDSTWRINGALP